MIDKKAEEIVPAEKRIKEAIAIKQGWFPYEILVFYNAGLTIQLFQKEGV